MQSLQDFHCFCKSYEMQYNSCHVFGFLYIFGLWTGEIFVSVSDTVVLIWLKLHILCLHVRLCFLLANISLWISSWEPMFFHRLTAKFANNSLILFGISIQNLEFRLQSRHMWAYMVGEKWNIERGWVWIILSNYQI